MYFTIIEEQHFNIPRDELYMRMFLRPTHYYPEGAMKRVSYKLHHSYHYKFLAFIENHCNFKFTIDKKLLQYEKEVRRCLQQYLAIKITTCFFR